VSDEDQDDEGQRLEAAHVWARDGEGPHVVIVPPTPSQQPDQLPNSKAALADLHDLVVMAGEAQTTAVEMAPAVASVGASPPGTPPLPGGAESPGEVERPGKVGGPGGGAGEGEEGNERGEIDLAEAAQTEDQEADGQDSQATPASKGSPSQDEIAVGYIIPLVLYLVFYVVNFGAGGYCLSSDRMNALGDIFFLWTPALCALCLLIGSKWLKLAGAVLILPLAGAAVYGGQYYHAYERFQTESSPYGPLIKAYDANGWRICRYESSWNTGNQPGITYTREKDVAPYIRYVKKMRLGEPP
jgi:hypothetical protein